MQDQTGITITSELDLQNMQRAADMPCEAVLDLRFTSAANARPVEEEVLLRLRNLQVGYEQLPIDLHKPHGRQKNDLTRQIVESHGRMMIITDQPEAVSAFCSDIARTVPHHPLPQSGIAGYQRSEAA